MHIARFGSHVWQRGRYGLGESPRWHLAQQTVSWVDIDAGHLWVADLSGGEAVSSKVGAPLGAYVLGRNVTAVAVGGTWKVAAGARGGAMRDWAELPDPALRFNDCGIDARGRLWSATMRRDEVMSGVPLGSLFRLDADGLTRQPVSLLAGNAVAWSPDSRTMYLVDSGSNEVLRLDYDLAAGSVARPQEWLSVPDGIPDGISVDRDGCVWVAVWGTGEVRRYTAEGQLTGVVAVPTPQVTALCFAGPDLQTMIITTAATGADPSDTNAGAIFAATVDVPGMPANVWNERVSLRPSGSCRPRRATSPSACDPGASACW